MKEILPLHDYVVLEEILPEKDSTFELPDSEEEQANRGKVLKINEYMYSLETLPTHRITVGDEVLFKRHLFDEVNLNNQKRLIGRQENVIAVIK